MWPSLATAERVFDWSNLVLIVSLSVGVVATLLVVWMGRVKEEYLARDLAASQERVAHAELETQRLRAAMAWRRVNSAQRAALVAALRGSELTVWTSWVGRDPEATLFRNDVDAALREAGIQTRYFSGLDVALGFRLVGPPGEDRDTLERAFASAGLPFDLVEAPTRGDNLGGLAIVVGTKPEPRP